MKTAILTLPFDGNIGGILQAYALQSVTERINGGDNSVDIITIQYLPRVPNWFFRPFIYSYRLLQRKRGQYDSHLRIEEVLYNRRKPMWRFMQNNMHLRVIGSLKDVNENEYDTFIVGSDQVWRPI